MDPTPPDQSLTASQETSPPSDPATAQASRQQTPRRFSRLPRSCQLKPQRCYFIDADFVTTNHLPVLSCAPHVTVAALDGRPLGSGKVLHTTDDITLRVEPSHQETIHLFVISSPQSPIILGYPWLNLHGPTIAWANRTITRWSLRCQEHCLQPRTRSETPLKDHTTKNAIPTVYQDLLEAFSPQKATQLPPHRQGDCAIDLLPGATPPRGRIFPLSQAESAAMDTYIQEELAKGFIRPSTSPASAGFFFVKKKDGGLRPCIDYRGLNEMTIKYHYPLPLVPSALEQLRTAKIFTKLDLRSAYNLIRIRAGDEWKTAFSTTSGHYEYRAFINEVFRDMLQRWVIVYIDDILIYSNSYDEHVRHVRAVLQRLIKHQLYAKEEKCEFHLDKISFLGYVISSEGVAMDKKKVNAVLNWPRPTMLRELQRFLGFSNFYRHFIRQFSSVAAPLTAMVKKGASRLTWTQPALQAFNDLRLRFSTAPILHHPDPDKPFVVEVDASTDALSRIHEPDRPISSTESVLPASMIVAPVTWDIMTEISEAQTQDPTPADCPNNLVYVPLTLRARVLAKVHATPSSGHPGIEATLHLLGNRFCLLQPLPVPQRPWSHIAVDFITDLPPSNGFTTILSAFPRVAV
ncbi:Transposon Tf2-6 polyprotein [Labeo rohita]|uniref:ribonuclease H n=1 Tax=Labeo rohita TaxID=84645 RepID=A0ABQ8L8I4_LABRO|nr:Transposon Tf2-6 polyprotein [Labeo rohita]